MPYQVFGERAGAVALMMAWSRSAFARSGPSISAIFASTALSPFALPARGPRRASALSSWARSRIAARSSSVNPFDARFLSAIPKHLRSLEQRVDARKAGLRALLDAVLHRRVALLGRREAHRLRQLRLPTEIFELERLQVVLEGLHEALGRLDLAKLPLDGTERRSESVAAARTDVHLLDDRAVAPPFGDQLRIRPDREDVRARRVEDPLDSDLELVRGGDGGGSHRAPFVRSTTCAKRSSRCSHVLMPSKAYGTSVHLRTRPTFSVVTSSASSSKRTCFFIPVSDMPNGSASSLIVALPAPSRSSTARRGGSERAAKARSTVVQY